jgi:tRNA A-37 threonylcarbamoyl transferase component Bud32
VAKQKVAAAQIGDDDETLIFQADADSDETILMPGSEVEDPDATLLMPASEDEDADATLLMPGSEDEDADVDATLIYPIETDDSGTVIVSEPAQDQTVVEEQATSTRPEKQDDGPLELGREFGKRYHIIKLLGLGGMGAVYQAWDVVLGIVVALKVVRPEVGADPKMAEELDQRFKRELLLAREVTHKNVVRIHDLGEIDGIKYITMTFIDGEDLSSVLKRQGKLAVPEALHVFRSVLSGLLAVHEAGVVHRDLKPANIILGTEDKEAYLMDFGVARSSSESAPKPSIEGVPIEKLKIPELGQTMAGAVVGTLQYMAPEQFRGKIADQRSDLYTLGLILYDLLVGSNRAKSAKSAIKEVMKRS